ncbi:MAG: hypothetical protein GX115_08890 [Ruminiclostridium sp.]|nr:hypothetical protein [Ruminiclostridium sp.]
MMHRQEYQAAKKVWKDEDRRIRGEIARYLTMKEASMKALGACLGISRTTMYAKFNEPSKFTLEEYRILEYLFRKNL